MNPREKGFGLHIRTASSTGNAWIAVMARRNTGLAMRRGSFPFAYRLQTARAQKQPL